MITSVEDIIDYKLGREGEEEKEEAEARGRREKRERIWRGTLP